MNQEKQRVHDFWNRAACGEELYLTHQDRTGYMAQANARYELEPYIPEFAGFRRAKGLRVLEIGVGLGADHLGVRRWSAAFWCCPGFCSKVLATQVN